MLCSCFLPTCHVCSSPCRVAGSSAARAPPSRVAVAGPSGAQPGCWCFLPGCATCSPRPQQRGSRGGDEGYCLSGKGRTLTPEAVAVIASVDDRLREMLEGQAESKAYLQQGPAFAELPSAMDGLPHASRHDRLVALLCNVGVRAVQSSRVRAAAARERGWRLPAASGKRGAKRKTVENHASSQSHSEDCEEEKETSSAFAAAG